MTAQPITSGQIKQIVRFGSDAVDAVLKELGLSKDGAQCVIEQHGDEFCAAMRNAARTALTTMSVLNQFADEEIRSNYTYPKGYRVKGVVEQTNLLRQIFPGIGFAHEKVAENALPEHAEGWFAIPRWQSLAPTYREALEKVLAAIASRQRFYNYREGQLTEQYLRQHARTETMLQQVGDQQKDHDILVIPAQFGLRHRGRSVRRARVVFKKTEFGLGSFAVGCMLLTHPERLVRWEQLHVDCAGDEYSPGAGGDFSGAPLFCFYDGKVRFNANWFDNANENYGSASAFLPKSLLSS